MKNMGEMLNQMGSTLASLMFFWAIFKNYFPDQLRLFLEKQYHKLQDMFNPYIQITFFEYSKSQFTRSQAYTSIETYLSDKSSMQAKRLKADIASNSQSLVLSIDDYEEVTDEFKGVKLWWASSLRFPTTKSISLYPGPSEKRSYKLTFHRRHRELVTSSYLDYVVSEGKAIAMKKRQRRLYTNGAGESGYSYGSSWSHVIFEHPATFDTLAMEAGKKEEIVNDLITFSKSKEYYAKIGKPWRRGYLPHGPPGTGKSTMIAAMANLLSYDVYDLELTAVKHNTELRKLLIETSSKSIIVIEDIDCSLDLTRQREKVSTKDKGSGDSDDVHTPTSKPESERTTSKVTLSGLLNIIDGLWSACECERVIVFTTNYVDKLDPALIRRGRMDKHIELSDCSFEGFKVLAKNYWNVESHHVFDTVRYLLEEVNTSPADVAEILMPKSFEDDAESRLRALISALEAAKMEATKNAQIQAQTIESAPANELEPEKDADYRKEG